MGCNVAVPRPVFDRDALQAMGNKILRWSTSDQFKVSITHTARFLTRVTPNRVLTCDDRNDLEIHLVAVMGGRSGIGIHVNQSDDASLRAAVEYVEALARQQPGSDRNLDVIRKGPRTIPPVTLWHESTVSSLDHIRSTVMPEMLDAVIRAGATGAGFVGVLARSQLFMYKDGLIAFGEETDAECTVTVRSNDGAASGWDGHAGRDWTQLHPSTVTANALAWARRASGARPFEPGRRTTILSPFAVAQIVFMMRKAFNAYASDNGMTPFSNGRFEHGNKIGRRIFDPHVNMSTDPSDPDGGYMPFLRGAGFFDGMPLTRVLLVEHGVLANLAYDFGYARERGKAYTEAIPPSVRLDGGQGTVDDLIAQCEDGIYVHRLSNVTVLDDQTGMMTGVTRDGCFLVKNGKLGQPIKNFRFTDSPFLFFNNIDALGTATRVALGYTPDADTWPAPPIIVPPVRVRDFNFSALSDAV